MPDIARVDAHGTLLSVETVTEDQWVTSSTDRTVQLPDLHDMRGRIKQMYYDFVAGCFMPIVFLNRSGPDVLDVSEAVIDAIVILAEHTQADLPSEVYKALGRKKKDTI